MNPWFKKMLSIMGSALMLWATSMAVARADEQRVISIGGALTEIIYDLGAAHSLVGVDTTSVYPSQARQLPKVGYLRKLSSEGLIALNPNLIVATPEAGPLDVVKQLKQSGIKFETLDSHRSFEGLVNTIEKLGVLLHKEGQAKQFAQKLKTEWTQTQDYVKQVSSKPVRVIFILSHAPGMALIAGKDTEGDAMIHLAGGINAVSSFTGYKSLTPEALIQAKPDVVLFSDMGLKAIGGIDGALKIPGLLETPAGKNKRIIAQDIGLLLNFGPRLPLAVRELAKEIHEVK